MTPCLTFEEIARLFSKVSVPFSMPTSKVWAFRLLHILTNTGCSQFRIFLIGNGNSLWFYYAFPSDWWCWIYFHVLLPLSWQKKKISNIYFGHRSCPGLHYPEFLRLLFCIMLWGYIFSIKGTTNQEKFCDHIIRLTEMYFNFF